MIRYTNSTFQYSPPTGSQADVETALSALALYGFLLEREPYRDKWISWQLFGDVVARHSNLNYGSNMVAAIRRCSDVATQDAIVPSRWRNVPGWIKPDIYNPKSWSIEEAQFILFQLSESEIDSLTHSAYWEHRFMRATSRKTAIKHEVVRSLVDLQMLCSVPLFDFNAADTAHLFHTLWCDRTDDCIYAQTHNGYWPVCEQGGKVVWEWLITAIDDKMLDRHTASRELAWQKILSEQRPDLDPSSELMGAPSAWRWGVEYSQNAYEALLLREQQRSQKILIAQ